MPPKEDIPRVLAEIEKYCGHIAHATHRFWNSFESFNSDDDSRYSGVLHQQGYVYSACNFCIVVSFISLGISRFDPENLFLYAAAILVIFNAFNNWYLIERNKSLNSRFKRKMVPASDEDQGR